MNLADPELELVDPTPNVHIMFIHFDQTFFGTKLASRAVVRWSKRMYSCAGVCSYEGRGGLCDIALSEPLLKLRPRKDLVETLLHEMIHAFLFITRRDQDRDGHGPNFQAHMHRINRAAGLNISIYHDFHDEVELYQTHWWRCDGPCQTRRPHFGIVRRCVNHAPGPKDFWWSDHQRKCGGNFIKFKEPENTRKKAVPAKPKGDITKFITTTTKSGPPVGEPKIIPNESKRPLLTKSNGSNTVVAVKKGVKTINTPNFIPPAVFTGKGHMIPGSKDRSISVNVAEAVRNVWANKQLPNNTTGAAYLKGKLTTQSSIIQKLNTDKSPNNGHLNSSRNNIGQKAIKHRADSPHTDSPPVKIKKIDDYFKTTATSLLKDIYGGDIEITESKNTNKLVAVQTGVSNSKLVQVDCPICKLRIDESVINQHLDECLNKDMISQLCTSTDESNQPYATPDCPNLNKPPVKVEPLVKLEPVKDEKQIKPSLEKMVYNLPPIPPYKGKQDDVDSSLNFTIMRKDLDRSITTFRGTFRSNTIHQNAVVKEPKNLDDNLNWEDVLGHEEPTEFDPKVVENVKCIVKKIDFEKHLRKSDNYVLVKEEIDLPSGFLPSFISEEANTIKLPPVKLEPGIDVITALREQKCPCCGNKVTKAIDEHLDECLAFFVNSQEPEEGASTSFANQTIVIDDEDDIFDESQVLNATGTKLPCPCCLKMVENNDMNSHLDSCLS